MSFNMSVNDSDEWASMIINEIREKAKTFETISLCSNADNKDVNGKRKSIKISDQNTDFTRSVSENSKDQLVDFPHSYLEKLEKNDLIFNTSKNIYDGFYQIDGDNTARINDDQDIFANGQNVTPDFKSNVEMTKMINAKDVSADSAGKPIDREAKSDIASMSKSETENLKEKKFIDLNEDFLLDCEMNSRKAEKTVETVEISFSSESFKSTKDFSNMSHVKSDISDSFSLRDSHSSYKDKKNEFCFEFDDDLSENFSDKVYLHNHNTDFQEQLVENNCDLDQFRDKDEIQTNNLSSVDAYLETAVGFSQDECLNRIDKKIKRIGFRNLQKEKSKSAKRPESQPDLSFEWFNENYITEEMKCHLKPTGEFDENDFLAANSSKDFENLSVIQNANKGAKNVDAADEIRKNWYIKNTALFDEYTDRIQKTVNVNNERSEGKQSNEIANDINEIDGEEQEIRNQRATFVVHRYKDIVLKFEIYFIRPFANVIAVISYEVIIFVFYLIICIFVFLYDRVQFLISNYASMNGKKPLNNSAYEDANVAINTEETTESTTIALDGMLITEDAYSGEKGETTLKLSPEKRTYNEIHRNLNSWIHVEPEEVEVIYMSCECVTGNVTKSYEKLGNCLTVFCNTEPNTASIKVNSDTVADFEFINNDDNQESELQLPENDFDMQIIASSKGYGIKEIDSHELHKSYHIEGTPKLNKDRSEVNSLIMRNSKSFFTKILPGASVGGEKPLFNSTEVDGLEMKSMSKHRCCSNFDVLSALNVDEDDNCFKIQVSPKNSSEEICLNSSLSVNLPSFCSRSGILSESTRLLENSEGVSDNECINSADSIKISKEMKRKRRNALLSKSLCFSKSKDSPNTSIFDAKNSLKKEEDENFIESVNDTLKNLGENSHMVRHNSGYFSVSDSADVYFQENRHHSFMCGDSKFVSCLSNPNIKDEPPSNAVKDNLKKKNNMRRRMSSMLENWKNRQVMSACMGNPPKSKKKCNRNDVTKKK